MKKLISIITFLIFLTIGTVYAFKPYAYLFVGRWQPAEHPLLIDDYGYQDIQNLRQDGKRLRGVSGHTSTANGIIDAVFFKIRNGFHFTKEGPAESHILVLSQNSAGTDANVYQNTTTIPDVGDFSATVLYSGPSPFESGLGRFSDAPNGNVLFSDGANSMIWGGDELRTGAFITSRAAIAAATVTQPKDHTEAINNSSSASGFTVTINAATDGYFLIGSTRPLKGVKLYISSPNASAGTLTTKEWDGTSWSNLVITDNTSGLDNTNTVTWDSTVTTSEPKYLEGYILYWYQFALNLGSATINFVTLDAPWQNITNIWSGEESTVASAKKYDGTTYIEYTDETITNDTEFVFSAGSLTTSGAIYLGFTEPQQALNIRMLATKENSFRAATLTVKYSDGSGFASVSNMFDGTNEGGISLGKTGVITWSPVAKGSEFRHSIAGEIPLYYYELTFDANISIAEFYYATGIEAPDTITGYRFPGEFQERSWLFSEKAGEQNKAIYSGFNAPDVWNGSDTGALFFGDEKRLIAAKVLYNYYQSSGVHQLIVAKRHETYRVVGFGPSSWEVQKISGKIGCVAPLSMVVAEIADLADDAIGRQVLIWQGDHGVYLSDGATVIKISEDIANYFDPQQDDYIPADRIDDSVGWYDANLNVYKLLVSSGSGQATHNVELEYSLLHRNWTKLYRENTSGANPFQAGWPVIDTDGNQYSYGATDEGFVYRTESGTSWAGTAIEQFVHTKAVMLDDEQPMFRHTVINYWRLLFEDKDGAATLTYLVDGDGFRLVDEDGDSLILSYGEQIAVTHYCNQSATLAADAYQHVVDSVNLGSGMIDTQDVVLGPCLSHSFKLTANITDVTDGMELLGLGLYYDPKRKIIIDD